MPLPHSYGGAAALSQALLQALRRPLEKGFLQRSSLASGLPYGSGLGILIWSLEGQENEGLSWPFSGEVARCLTFLPQKPPPRPPPQRHGKPAAAAAALSAAGAEDAAAWEDEGEEDGRGVEDKIEVGAKCIIVDLSALFSGGGQSTPPESPPAAPAAGAEGGTGDAEEIAAAQRQRSIRAVLAHLRRRVPAAWESRLHGGRVHGSHRLCALTALQSSNDVISPYDSLRTIESDGKIAVRMYLDTCLGLDREEYHPEGSRFHAGTLVRSPPPPPGPPPPPAPPIPSYPPAPRDPPEPPLPPGMFAPPWPGVPVAPYPPYPPFPHPPGHGPDAEPPPPVASDVRRRRRRLTSSEGR